MINLLEKEILSHGDKSKVVPIDWFEILKNDVQALRSGTSIYGSTRFGISKLYEFRLPKLNFDIKSIVIVASPSPFVEVIFNYNNMEIPLALPPGCVEEIMFAI